jgi:hypothetical protein
MATGECNCAAVSFKISSKISDVYICHCSICRRSTGSGGIAVLLIENSAFSWIGGQELIKTWHKPGHDWQTSFCTNCGSSLPGINDDSHTYVPAGLILSGDLELKVTHHLWVSSKATWEEIADSGKQHFKSFEA